MYSSVMEEEREVVDGERERERDVRGYIYMKD